MKIKKLLIAPGLATVLAVAACGGPEDFAGVLDAAVADGLPGVALYVRSDDDGAVWIGHAGVSSIENATPLTADDKFMVFGATQPFMAVTVLQMADEGLLGLDNTVPQLAGLELVYDVPNVQRITLRPRCVTHPVCSIMWKPSASKRRSWARSTTRTEFGRRRKPWRS